MQGVIIKDPINGHWELDDLSRWAIIGLLGGLAGIITSAAFLLRKWMVYRPRGFLSLIEAYLITTSFLQRSVSTGCNHWLARKFTDLEKRVFHLVRTCMLCCSVLFKLDVLSSYCRKQIPSMHWNEQLSRSLHHNISALLLSWHIINDNTCYLIYASMQPPGLKTCFQSPDGRATFSGLSM